METRQAESVLLGILDEPIASGRATYTTNKIGGLPDWPGADVTARCEECGRQQVLVCQIYCPLEGSDHHRTLYIFACTNKPCWNQQTSWRVLRCQVQDINYRSHAQSSVSMAATPPDDWGVGTDDWGTSDVTDWGSDANDWGDSCSSNTTEGTASNQPTEPNLSVAEGDDHFIAENLQSSVLSTNPESNGEMRIKTDTFEKNAAVLQSDANQNVKCDLCGGDTDTSQTTHNAMQTGSKNNSVNQPFHSECCQCSKTLTDDKVSRDSGDFSASRDCDITCTSSNCDVMSADTSVPESTETQIESDLENMILDNREPDSDNLLNTDTCNDKLLELKDTSIANYLKIGDAKTSENDSLKISTDSRTETVRNEKCMTSNDAELCAYYVSVVEEPDDVIDTFRHEQALLRDYARSGNMDFDPEALTESSSKASSKEGYEKSAARHGDKIFHKFMKRVSRCPQQILRYHYGGTALPLASNDNDVISACKMCGSARIFELQLMPGLVSFLKTKQCSENVVEFGTVMVYTCKASCWSDSYTAVEEHIVVQPDPDQHLFKM